MKIMGKYIIAVMAIALLIGLGACKIDPTELLVADNGVTINYTGKYNSKDNPPLRTLTVKNNINSNIFSIFLMDASADPISDDLLGSFDCIGAGRTNTISGVPGQAGSLYVYFADTNTGAVEFSGCNFAGGSYTLTIKVDTSSVGVLTSPNIAQPAGTNPNSRQIVKDGIVYTLTATPQ